MDINCICPPKADGTPRHDHDTITLREKMDFRSSIAIRNALALESGDDGAIDMADILAILTERFILYGVQSWTVVDAKNQPVPVSREAITRLILSDIELATDIGDAADARYRDAVMLPLLQRGQTSSPSTPTNGSTSRRTGRSTTPRKRSSPSSITAIPTAGTGTTSSAPDGDSSSLPRSA
jgi:hypothetical protein